MAETLPAHHNPKGRSPGSPSPSRVPTGQINLEAGEHRSPLMKATWPGPGHKGQTRMEWQAFLGSPEGQTSPLRRLHRGLSGWDSKRPVLIQWEGKGPSPTLGWEHGLEQLDSSSMKPPVSGFHSRYSGLRGRRPLPWQQCHGQQCE